MQRRWWNRALLSRAAALALAVVAAAPASGCRIRTPVENGSWIQGYAILHDLLSDEADADMILWVKLESDDLENAMVEISRSAAEWRDQVAAYAEQDKRIKLEIDPLHAIEAEARSKIESATAWELITASGAEFEVRLLLTQLQALRYAAALSRALADHEKDEGRRQFLRHLATRADELHTSANSLLLARLSRGKD